MTTSTEPTTKPLGEMNAKEVIALADAEEQAHRTRQKHLRALARALETQ